MNPLKAMAQAVLPERVQLHLRAIDHYWNGEPEIRLLKQLCQPERTAIDAGANIGTYSYFMRKHASCVIAYEPNPGLAQRLARLLPEIEVRRFALSDQPGQVVLKVPIDAHGALQHELASIAQDFDGATCDYLVQAITIDSEGIENVGFLKVDVEQHEREVLRGALVTIQRCRPVVMTEMSPLRYEHEVPEVFRFVTECGYVGWFRFGGSWLPFMQYKSQLHANHANYGKPDLFAGGNLLFFPREHSMAQSGPQS